MYEFNLEKDTPWNFGETFPNYDITLEKRVKKMYKPPILRIYEKKKV
jgi:hypothetical protein